MTIKGILVALLLIFIGWIRVMALVMLISDAAPAAVVVSPNQAFFDKLPEETAILASSPISVTLKYDAPAVGRTLYAAGAILVLPGIDGLSAFAKVLTLHNAV